FDPPHGGPGRGAGRLPGPDDPGRPGGGAPGGVRPDGPGEGLARPAGADPPRPAEQPHPRPDPGGHRVHPASGRQCGGGEPLCPARPGEPGLPGHRRPGPPPPPRDRPGHGGRGAPDQPPPRYPLRRGRPAGAVPVRRRPPWNLVAGGLLLALVAGAALLSLVWVPHDPNQMAVTERLAPPSRAHPLGTDPFGRDLLSRVMVGARTTLGVGPAVVLVGAGAGVALGTVAGLGRGGTDEVLMRLIDALAAFPSVLLALMLVAVMGPGAVSTTLALGLAAVPAFARLTRSGLLSLRESPLVEAARAVGAGPGRLFRHHLLPNLEPLFLVEASLTFARAVVAEAGLSYLGLGIQPPWPSWGRMLREAQSFIALSPYPALAPGLAMVLTVLGLHLVGDGLRDRWTRR